MRVVFKKEFGLCEIWGSRGRGDVDPGFWVLTPCGLANVSEEHAEASRPNSCFLVVLLRASNPACQQTVLKEAAGRRPRGVTTPS